MKKIYIILLSLALVIVLTIFCVFLKTHGFFNVEETILSPDRQTQTTIYNRTKNSKFTKYGFTVTTQGRYNSTTIYENADYVGFWWSPDNRYYLIDLDRNGLQELYLTDLLDNQKCNMHAYLYNAMYGHIEFDDLPKGALRDRLIEYEFVCWDTRAAKVHLSFRYKTEAGEERHGSFWYDCDTQSISDIILENE